MLRTHVAIDVTGGLPTVDADLAELQEIAHRVGDRWTRAQVAGHPRSVPERGAVQGLPDRTRALLGPARYAREESAGAALTPAELAAELTGS